MSAATQKAAEAAIFTHNQAGFLKDDGLCDSHKDVRRRVLACTEANNEQGNIVLPL